jgi:arabinose-5-phosphate isomerase
LKNSGEIKKLAIDTILLEAGAIRDLAAFVDDDFVSAVELIYSSAGRVVVTGIGKSAIVASKIVATLNSTGTPAIYMHAADAIHGDLGIIQPDDVILCLSKSGNTPEIKVLVPLIRNMGNKLIGMVSNRDSFLSRQADLVLKAFVDKEACPLNLAPTTSTTAQMVFGDALALCLLKKRGFSTEDYARFHPGGSLGKKLYLRVRDFYSESKFPQVKLTASIREVIVEISSRRLGATAVLDEAGNLAGIITDGDLRRMLEKNPSIEHLTAGDIMSSNPRTIDKDTLAIDAFNLMKQHNITQLLITDHGRYTGIIHLHDILKEGVV